MVQWLRIHASNAGVGGSIPGQRTKIPHATWGGQKQVVCENGSVMSNSL